MTDFEALSSTGGRQGWSALACPTCYVVAETCDRGRCHDECHRACQHDAIRLEGGKATVTSSCVSCSACIAACPLHAIDKAPLEALDGGLRCARCGSDYPDHDGVLDLLPRGAAARANPFFEYYEKDYVVENPQMHLEDTELKERELLPILGGRSFPRLLDLGCGGGELGRRIAAHVGATHTTSSDWSTSILAFARSRNPQGLYLRADAAYLPFRNDSYDLTLLADVLEHQTQPRQVLVELQRVSRHLLIRVPLEDCWFEDLRRRRRDRFHESCGHVVFFRARSIVEWLTQAGFGIIKGRAADLEWAYYRRVMSGSSQSLFGKLIMAVRLALRVVLPRAAYRRVFATNYVGLCESQFLAGHPAAPTAKSIS